MSRVFSLHVTNKKMGWSHPVVILYFYQEETIRQTSQMSNQNREPLFVSCWKVHFALHNPIKMFSPNFINYSLIIRSNPLLFLLTYLIVIQYTNNYEASLWVKLNVILLCVAKFHFFLLTEINEISHCKNTYKSLEQQKFTFCPAILNWFQMAWWG